MPVNIAEFDRRAADSRGSYDALPRPPGAVQPQLDLVAGTTARSMRLQPATRLVRLTSDQPVRVRVYDQPIDGPDTTAANATGSDGKSEFFFAGESVIGIQANGGRVRLAVILAE